MERFLFNHDRGTHKGFACAFRFRRHKYIVLRLGYGKPVWWKPRLLGGREDDDRKGIGFGWLFLCFQMKIVELEL